MENTFYLIFSGIALIIAITIHEFSHAFMADQLGDPTPRSQDRLTLNPLKHLDLFGTIMLLTVGFGWGKPVQIDSYNFKKPKRDELFVALAGPVSNIILATLLSIGIKFFSLNHIVLSLLYTIIQMNIVLAIFNLIPIPPLDGSKILLNSLPQHVSSQWEQPLEKYGPFILLALVFLPMAGGSNIISSIIGPIIGSILKLLI